MLNCFVRMSLVIGLTIDGRRKTVDRNNKDQLNFYIMTYKFENLDVWKLSMQFNDVCYTIAGFLPESEKYNLSSQLKRASTSIALNIAEGSTSQSDAEQKRFLGYAIRSHIETIACLRLIERRNYLADNENIKQEFEKTGAKLFGKLQAFRNSLG